MKKKIARSRMWFYILYPLMCYFVFAYPLSRLSDWFSHGSGIGMIVTLCVWVFSVVAMWYSFSGPKIIVRYVMVHWMGASFVFAVLVLVAEGLRTVFDVDDILTAQTVLLAGGVCIFAAILFSHHLSLKRMEIRSNKVTKDYRIAQISDVHIGSRQSGYMQRIVNKLNSIEPDYIVITGDLVDSSAVGFDALESISQLNAKVFFIIGNHERYADLPKILDIAERVGMHTLRQESVSIDDLLFIGIDDADHKGQVAEHLPHINKSPDKFNVLLYHRPLGWESAIEHGVDLMLSGHTHNGQIFPFNYIVKQQFKRICGMYREGDARLYVSPGTGTWGPLMRLGSLNEISIFEIKPH